MYILHSPTSSLMDCLLRPTDRNGRSAIFCYCTGRRGHVGPGVRTTWLTGTRRGTACHTLPLPGPTQLLLGAACSFCQPLPCRNPHQHLCRVNPFIPSRFRFAPVPHYFVCLEKVLNCGNLFGTVLCYPEPHGTFVFCPGQWGGGEVAFCLCWFCR